MTHIRILHLSDLHTRRQDLFDESAVVRGMLADVVKRHQERQFDLVAFTGDLAFAGKAAELELGNTVLLDPLMSSLGLESDRVAFVAGNHDVDIDQVNPVFEAGLATNSASRDDALALQNNPDAMATALDRLGPWTDFASRFYHDANHIPVRAGGWMSRLVISGRSIGIAS